MLFINIGFGNMVAANRVVAISSPESSPVKRLVAVAKEEGRIIDLSCGHKTKTVIITDSEHVILSALPTERIADRLNGLSDNNSSDDEDIT